jgi:hypothetical protein
MAKAREADALEMEWRAATIAVAASRTHLRVEKLELVAIDECMPLRERIGRELNEQLRYLASYVDEEHPIVLGDVFSFDGEWTREA